MRPGLAKIIEKVCISRNYESPETDLHIAENACCSDYTNTWSSKRVHWLSKSQGPHRSATNYGCENTLELDTGVPQACLPIMRIDAGGAYKPNIQRFPATLHHTGWVDHCQIWHGSSTAIPVLDPVDVETAYCYSPSRHQCLQSHVRSHGWPVASFGQEEDRMEGRLILGGQVCAAEAVQILYGSDSNDWYGSHFGASPWSFPEVAIVQEVGHGNRY